MARFGPILACLVALAAPPAAAECRLDPALLRLIGQVAGPATGPGRFDAEGIARVRAALSRLDPAETEGFLATPGEDRLTRSVRTVLAEAWNVARSGQMRNPRDLAEQLDILGSAADPDCGLAMLTPTGQPSGFLPIGPGPIEANPNALWIGMTGAFVFATLIAIIAAALMGARRLWRVFGSWRAGRRSCLIQAQLLFDAEDVPGIVTLIGPDRCLIVPRQGAFPDYLPRLAAVVPPRLSAGGQVVEGRITAIGKTEIALDFDTALSPAELEALLSASAITPYLSTAVQPKASVAGARAGTSEKVTRRAVPARGVSAR
ncbi:hypothetical protein HKCCE3408_02585 [Rhodobacterales bacterium HKCCE3408]|nr:hypothetical protein [Rhodobacterales bacterium HKCCE3408]